MVWQPPVLDLSRLRQRESIPDGRHEVDDPVPIVQGHTGTGLHRLPHAARTELLHSGGFQRALRGDVPGASHAGPLPGWQAGSSSRGLAWLIDLIS